MGLINYAKHTWDTKSYVTPTPLNEMENGIMSACDGVDGINTNLGTKPSGYSDVWSNISYLTGNLAKFINNGKTPEYEGDLNAINTNGFFNVAPQSTNYPPLKYTTWGFVISLVHNDLYATQIYTTMSYDSPLMFIRQKVNGVWSAWEGLVTESELNNKINQISKEVDLSSTTVPANSFVPINIGQLVSIPSGYKIMSYVGIDIYGYADKIVPVPIDDTTVRLVNLSSNSINLTKSRITITIFK